MNSTAFEPREIGNRIRTQNGRCTRDPIFLVQEKVRIYGIDTDYDPEIAWLYEDESVEVSPHRAARLEKIYQASGKEREGYRRAGYVEEWRYVQTFFTKAAAELYIQHNGHRHRGKLRTYVDSLYRNQEMIAVREYLMSLCAPEEAPHA